MSCRGTINADQGSFYPLDPDSSTASTEWPLRGLRALSQIGYSGWSLSVTVTLADGAWLTNNNSGVRVSDNEATERLDGPQARSHDVGIGRAVLFTLVGIHWILPFTPVNPHDEMRIIVASFVLGATFLALVVWSYTATVWPFVLGSALLAVVIAVSATTGASPLGEGAVVKVLFLSGLCWAVARARVRSA